MSITNASNASNASNAKGGGFSNNKSLAGLKNSMMTRASPLSEKYTGKSPDQWMDRMKEETDKLQQKMNEFGVDWKSALTKQMDTALASTDYAQVNRLLDSAAPSMVLSSSAAPEPLKRAASQVASRQLGEAIRSEVPKQIKGALVAAERLQATAVPEFAQAVEKYKQVRKLPAGWDVGKMVLHREGKMMVAKMQVDDPAVKARFQRLLDLTHRKVYTRDRMGQAVPERLEIVRITTITNDELWGDYMARRESIRQELQNDPSDHEQYAVETMAVEVVDDSVTTDASAVMAAKESARAATGETAESIAASLAADFDEPMMAPVNEVFLFHGTSAFAAKKITTENLRMNLAGSNAGTLYGRGVYLAENSTKSDEYCRQGPDGERHLLVCRTVLGRVYYSDAVVTDPRSCEDACIKGKFHSVLGDRKKCRGTFREFIVFDKEQVYPNYIITYKRKEGAPADPSRVFQVECPKGSAGSVIQVQSPTGQTLHVLVPPGCKPGQKIPVQY